MRDVYNIKKKFAEITQGSIITGCIADGYTGCDVHGCVITARCDLAHSKIDTVHYLPMVCFKDWLHKEMASYIRAGYAKDLKSRLTTQLEHLGLEPGIIERRLLRHDIEKVIERNMSKPKEKKTFMENYDKWLAVQNLEMKQILSEKSGLKLLENEINRMVGHSHGNFYLIEGWKSASDDLRFMVILLRDVKHLTWDCASALPNGILEEEKDEAFFMGNMLAKTPDKRQMYYVDAEIKSPFIEHILQRFANNFLRIGVDDLPKADVSTLYEQAKNILQ